MEVTSVFTFGFNRQTDRQTEWQTDRQNDRQTEWQTERQTDRQTDRQTEWQTVSHFAYYSRKNSQFFNIEFQIISCGVIVTCCYCNGGHSGDRKLYYYYYYHHHHYHRVQIRRHARTHTHTAVSVLESDRLTSLYIYIYIGVPKKFIHIIHRYLLKRLHIFGTPCIYMYLFIYLWMKSEQEPHKYHILPTTNSSDVLHKILFLFVCHTDNRHK